MNSTLSHDQAWTLGIVSNCWKAQLDAGVELDVLVDESLQRGFRVIELRQGSLGKYEFGAMSLPRPDRLAELQSRFTGVQFNMAMSLPCLGGEMTRRTPLFVAGRAAAIAMARGGQPHLRLVDLETQPSQRPELTVGYVARALVELTESLIETHGVLSIENAKQPWPWFRSVLDEARRRLGHNATRLRCCFDPCNLLVTECPDDVPDIVASIVPDDVSMIHVKQRRDGQILPDVSAGDLDWPALLYVIQQHGHTAPVLFEVAPHADVWQHLKHGVSHLFEAVVSERGAST
ncbi:MAG: sugar phosphate isomerase/epimerase [Planctomycetales bacterium]|nr:sugar phosphate isomerase/epimerase [Planctomycetales bacterium]